MNEFTLRITKKGGKNGILVFASTLDNSYEIESVQYSDDAHALYDSFVNQRVVNYYTGPSFTHLDERLQNELNDFFASVGLNEELVSFINVLSLDKDQRLYLKWLKNLDRFFH